MTDTAPPEQVLTEAADKALVMAERLSRSASAEHSQAGMHMAYLAGLIRGGITNVVTAYDRGWDEGYDAAPTPLAAPADMAAVWQGLNDEQRAVVCIVSPELAGMLDAAEDLAPVEATEALGRWGRAQQSVRDAQDALTRVREDAEERLEDMRLSLAGKSEMGPPPYYLARLREALDQVGNTPPSTFDEVVDKVGKLRASYLQYRAVLQSALDVDGVPGDIELIDKATGVIIRARRAAHAWAGTGEPGEVAAAALQDLVHYLDERAA